MITTGLSTANHEMEEALNLSFLQTQIRMEALRLSEGNGLIQ